ncbi:MAG: carboxypeptidase regulatory-like domain-containing protein [Anaerolineales bacterium]|jgi:hypothetical protein|nr:carboxypeptidase regulatory-like domain-containing protein [Anaerolineales bacterium]
MKSQSRISFPLNGTNESKIRFWVSLIILTLSSLVFSSISTTTAVQGHSSRFTNDFAEPESIDPNWKNLGITWRVSIATDGTEGNSYVGQDLALSSDGRYVVFSSMAWNLVPGDIKDGGHQDIFLHDNLSGATERISVSTSGEPGNQDSFYGVDISSDGRYVVFTTKSNNLVSGDTNDKWDIFLRDRLANTTIRISVSSTGEQANGNSWLPQISEDGNIVVYTSAATNLVQGDTNSKWDIFAYNRLNGQTERISVSSAEVQGNNDSGDNKAPAVSADGRYVTFSSDASNLVSPDENNACDMDGNGTYTENCSDVFVRDRLNGTTEMVSINSSGTQGNNFSMLSSISADGNFVAFYSAANNLVNNDTNTCLTLFYNSGPCPDVFVRDRSGGITERVSVSSTGTQATIDPINYFKPPAISGDGQLVVFESSDTTLAVGATNGYSQILAHNRTTHETTLVSASTYRWQGNSWSHCPPGISTTGRYVAFYSLASDLVTNDANGFADIFVRDREGWTYAMDGTVRDEASNPIAGVWVGYDSGVGESKLTDTLGQYQLYYMPEGTYSVRAWKLGYYSIPAVQLVTLPPTTIGVDFILKPAALIFFPVVVK